MAKASKKLDDDDPPVKRNRRSRKDPRAPKRSKSAYIFFAIEIRESVKAEIGPDARVGDIAKLTSRRWKSLTDQQRLRYENVAKADRDRYLEEKAAYTGPLLIPPTEDGRSHRKMYKKRKTKDPAAPKRPLSAFLFFSQKTRPSLKKQKPGLRMAEMSQELGRRWREMTEVERLPYTKCEEESRERWLRESAKYKEKKSVQAKQKKVEEVKETVTKQPQKKVPKPPVKKDPPPPLQRRQYEDEPKRVLPHQADQHYPYNMYDMYRHPAAAAHHMNREDGYMGLGGQYSGGPNAFPGMVSHHRDAHSMMGACYPNASVAGSNPPYHQAHQQSSYYSEHGSASGRYTGSSSGGAAGMGMPQGMDMQGYTSSSMMGGEMPPSMGGYGYGTHGMMMDPTSGYGYMAGM